jgi:hypothetical protein
VVVDEREACNGVDDDHIVRQGLIQWNNQAGYQATIPSSDEIPPYTTGIAAPNVLKKMKYSFPSPERLKARFKEPIWIDGYDIIGLFHMQKHQLARFDIWPLERGNRFDKGFRTKKYRLDEVYAVATFTPNCPIQETPDQAVERYFKKFEKCGKGRWDQLNRLCECEDCSTMHCGGEPGEPWFEFYANMEREIPREDFMGVW